MAWGTTHKSGGFVSKKAKIRMIVTEATINPSPPGRSPAPSWLHLNQKKIKTTIQTIGFRALTG
jgi:hypothetical protein